MSKNAGRQLGDVEEMRGWEVRGWEVRGGMWKKYAK